MIDRSSCDQVVENVRWQPDMLRGPDLLSFAGIEPAAVPALPLEQQVAEKVQAYTRTYGDGESSSRVKDLVDLILVLRSLPYRHNDSGRPSK